MSIASFINERKKSIRAQKDKLLGSTEEKIKYLEEEKEYLNLKKQEQELKKETRSMKFVKAKTTGANIKKAIREFKQKRGSYVNSAGYKNNIWRNQTGNSSASTFGATPQKEMQKAKKKRKVIIEYE